ncbi:MAG: DUF5054 domain-containing protein [Acetobacter sp.]|nr:DUF5054 domain-containing protein [Bacteroides sp.]MCM1341085.1 DUF5054 domain-containing protein [Acetobacter sp.]MCM1433582.1 DUF5054 domain-containing protein [Clostridiales bacterium]
MKKVIVVSKTHLDLGFTDFAKNVHSEYIKTYIPNAISLAKQMNTPNKKKFVWTTGSWIIKEALKYGTSEQKENLIQALKRGDIVPHALPFTTHTELLDKDTMEYGLSIVDSLDKLRGRKTAAAKMTDVPGHTKAIIPMLQSHGIKLLHIGVNGASALADVPSCFLWKHGDSEVVVIYSGDYGGAFQCDLIDEILYFDHTLDNRGTPSADKIEDKLNAIASKYPGYEVAAGTMDDIAEIIWGKRDKLPVVTDELGDTWIHGSAADPYKSASLRALMRLKREWLSDGSMNRDSQEYIDFTDALLCIAEHTCGMDMKKYFADYENYLKADFNKARQTDNVKIRHLFRDFPQNVLTYIARLKGEYNKGSYSTAEKSWDEQREYIDKAVSALTADHRAEAEKELSKLVPKKAVKYNEIFDIHTPVNIGSWHLELNEYGGIGALSHNGISIIKQNNQPIIEYRSFGKKDYDFWLSHYSRNLKQNAAWAFGDFGRPLLKYADGKYPEGRFAYKLVSAGVLNSDSAETEICVDLECDKKLCSELGAPRSVQIIYCLTDRGLRFNASWYGKDANRLTEALYLHIFPDGNNIEFSKLGSIINPYEVVSMAGRKLHAIEYFTAMSNNKKYRFINYHSPVVSLGKGKILEFDNNYEDIGKDGITYVLHDNVWGTNFPLWYEDNAGFDFEISL